jgi:hypothetical protein
MIWIIEPIAAIISSEPMTIVPVSTEQQQQQV